MSGLSFSAVDESEQERVFATLVLAFAADPVERWLYPEPRQYLSQFPRFLAAFGGPAFAERTVWRLGEFSAVALWLPPGTEADRRSSGWRVPPDHVHAAGPAVIVGFEAMTGKQQRPRDARV